MLSVEHAPSFKMIENLHLVGKTIYLRKLTESDVSERYVQWLNDPEINRYMENRFLFWTMENLTRYVRQRKEEQSYFFAICLLNGDTHIGNIKLGPINPYHLSADIGLMIGDKACWSMGMGTEAIRLVTDFAFRELRLQKLTAGAYIDNAASIKAFEKCRFSKEGRLKNHVDSHGKRMDAVLLGYTAVDFVGKNKI